MRIIAFVIVIVVIVVVMLMMIVVVVIMVMMAGAMRIIAFVIVIVVMLVMIVVMVIMVMMAGAMRIVAFVIVIVVMMMMLCLMMQALELFLDGIASLHRREKLLAVKLTPRGGYDGCGCIMLTQKRNCLVKLRLRNRIGVREHDASGVLDLIVEEFAEVLHIHFALFHVDDRGKSVELHSLRRNVLHCTDDIRKLANARGLDEDTVGMIGCENLLERLAEIANERAADASAVHFGDLNACVLHKAAVDANLAEFVFNQHEFFARISLSEKLFDQRGLSRTEKARENINFGHGEFLLF